MALTLSIFAADARQSVPVIRRGIQSAHRWLRSPLRELSIAIVTAPKMASLHRKFLNERAATDVLTFELDHDVRGRTIAGEIVVCSTVARKNAGRLGHSISHELLLYAVHGLLHLSAFDDRTASAFAVMHRKEDEILTRLGIGPVFAARTRAARTGAG